MPKKQFSMAKASAPKPLREKQIEAYLCKQVKKRLGGTARKYNSPGRAAEPDRILTWEGLCVFVECKRPGEKPTPAQNKAMNHLRDDGQLVFWVDTKHDGEHSVDRRIDILSML